MTRYHGLMTVWDTLESARAFLAHSGVSLTVSAIGGGFIGAWIREHVARGVRQSGRVVASNKEMVLSTAAAKRLCDIRVYVKLFNKSAEPRHLSNISFWYWHDGRWNMRPLYRQVQLPIDDYTYGDFRVEPRTPADFEARISIHDDEITGGVENPVPPLTYAWRIYKSPCCYITAYYAHNGKRVRWSISMPRSSNVIAMENDEFPGQTEKIDRSGTNNHDMRYRLMPLPKE